MKPISLFRFEKLTDDIDENEKRLKTIANDQLWLSNPKTFNDLNDSRIRGMDMPRLSPDNLGKTLKCINTLYPEDFDYSDSILSKKMVDEIKNYINRESLSERSAAIVAIEESILNSTGICCFFSGDINNPLMWAHYANNHEGLCVEYEYTRSFNSQIHPVNYTNNWRVPSARELALCPDETMVRILTTKDTCWHYENEFRHVHFDLSSTTSENEKGKAITIPPCLKAKKIITGVNFKQDELSIFKEIILPKISFRDL